jgi:hypothetical protein
VSQVDKPADASPPATADTPPAATPDTRPPATIESEIETIRERLAVTIDQLAYRVSPKTIVRREVATLKGHYVDPQGQPRTDNILKAAAAVAGFVAVLLIFRKVAK